MAWLLFQGYCWSRTQCVRKTKGTGSEERWVFSGTESGHLSEEVDELYNKLLFNLLSSGLFPLRYVSILQIVIFLIRFLHWVTTFLNVFIPWRGYLMWMPLSIILWSGVWRLSFWWLVSEISDSAAPTVCFPPWEMGGGEGHCTSERALGMHLLSSQIPIKIDFQERLTVLLGMLRPRLPSVKIFMSFQKTKPFFMEEHWVPLDSPLVSCPKV